MTIAADVLIALMVAFSVRRLIWVIASWKHRRAPVATDHSPHVLIAVAFRDEQDSLPRLLSGLAALDYAAERLSICLVDDASTDRSAEQGGTWVLEQANRRLITLEKNLGKAAALNRALASVDGTPEVVVVYDADQCPHPDSLRLLVTPFDDPGTQAVCGYRRPVFPTLNPIVAYRCLEAWTHQLVNLAGKDALGLNPPTMGGNCAYRRSALRRIGGFPQGSASEDIEVSLALSGSGGKTRVVAEAMADDFTGGSFRRYLNQRFRWSLGLMRSRKRARGIEAAFVVAGYLDRVALLLVAAMVALGYAHPWWLLAYVIPAGAAVLTAVIKARPGFRVGFVVLAVGPAMFVVDVLVSLSAAVYNLLPRQ